MKSLVTVEDHIATQDSMRHTKIPCPGAGTRQCQDMVFFEYIRSPVTVKDDIATQDYIQHLKIPCLGAGTGQSQNINS